MADKNLIQGAINLGESKRQTWGAALQKGLAEGFAIEAAALQIRKAKKAQINQKVAGYIDSLNSNVDLTSLTEEQQASVTNYLQKEKMVYADAANRIAKLEPDNPQYMELRDQMNGIQMSFSNLASSLKQYKEDKKSYLEDFDKGIISDGNELNTLGEASDIYTDKGYAGVGPGGNLVFWDNENEDYKSYSAMQKPFLKDFTAADQIMQMNEQVYNAGTALSGTRENMIRQRLNTSISKGGRQSLLSLASDDFILEGGLGLQDPALFEVGNEAALKSAVLDGYMDILRSSAKQGAADKRPSRRGRGRGGFSGALNDEINLSSNIQSDAMTFSQLSRPAEGDEYEVKARSLVDALNGIDPTAKSPSYISRGQFYNDYLEAMDKDDSEKTRNAFKSEYGNAQIFKLAPNKGNSYGINVDTNDPQALYKLYIQNAGLSNKAQNYYIGQYGDGSTESKSGGGSMSKYNK
jgi:hypothetical protein